MIRNVVVGRVRDGVERATIQAALDALLALEPEGCREMRAGLDAGLRPGNWDFSITADFTDEAAYRRYDLEAEHNRIRAEMFAPICTDMVRIQFDTP